MSSVPFPSGKFRTILADPPWEYAQRLGREANGDTTRGGLPYASMSEVELRALNVGTLADANCQLYLWTTNSHMESAYRIVRAWGFEPKTILTWVKRRSGGPIQIGLGYWFRGATEHVIFAVKGNPRTKFHGPNGATGKAWSTVIEAPRGPHSAKPNDLYEIAEDVGEAPRIELFARSRRDGWEAWGNEAPLETLANAVEASEVVW